MSQWAEADDPEHRHRCGEWTTTGRCSGDPCVCTCGARLVVLYDFWDHHDQPLWWWLLPDGTYAPWPDQRELPAIDGEWERL